jgi:hypothetical protein
MRKFAVIAVAFTVMSANTPVLARDNTTPWIVGGIVGAIVGGALAQQPHYAQPYHAPPSIAYYPQAYYPAQPYYRPLRCHMGFVGYDYYGRATYQRFCD